jgi:hypothetical protein
MKDLDITRLPWVFLSLGACGLVVASIRLWRGRRQDRRDRHERRVLQRVSERLAEAYEQLLTPEETQRREAQRQHLQELRAQAEAELAAEAARGRRT